MKNPNDLPLVVCYGMGVDSTAVLVEFERLGIRPDLILFADTGSEADHTYAFHPVMDAWLKSVGFPPITVVKYQPKDFKHWPPYHSLEENCLTNSTLPSLAYGFKSCSQKWKIAPQETFCDDWPPAQAAWGLGMKIRKVVGYDNGPADQRRRNHLGSQDDPKYDYWYPLQDWGWDRDRCKAEIAKSTLPYVPEKSSCYFCPAMKPWELHQLTEDKLRRIIVIEARTEPRHIEFANAKRDALKAEIETGIRHKKKGELEFLTEKDMKESAKKLEKMGPHGTPIIKGLWRNAVKGMRGATPRPGSMTEYIRSEKLLDAHEIETIRSNTPTTPLSADDLDSWQEWLTHITDTDEAKTCEGCSCEGCTIK